jgi:diguanylate cyclase (GGDEF)-like protein/PAS domain S-box-containing protein
MRNLQLSTVLLFLMLGVLAITSVVLFAAVYYSADKAFQYEARLNYQRDQVLLNELVAGEFKNIQQISQRLCESEQLQQGLIAHDAPSITQVVDRLLASSAGEHIDAFVIEDNQGKNIVSNNVSLFGAKLPLQKITQLKTPSGIWKSLNIRTNGKYYSLIYSSKPVIGKQLGEVIGKLYTVVLLNNNFWLINKLQRNFGSLAISLNSGNIILDDLESQSGQLQVLQNKSATDHDDELLITANNTVRTHYLRLDDSEQYKVRSLQSNNAQLILREAYTSHLLFASALVVLLAFAAMLTIRQLICTALQQLTRYAEQIPQNGLPSPFKEGRFYEFIRVGAAIEKMLLRIRERDKQVSCIIDHSPNLIEIRDLQNNFRLVNKRFAEILDMTPEQLLSNQEKGTIEDGLIDLLCEADQEVLANHSAIHYEMKIVINNELRTFLVNRFPITDDHKKLYLIGSVATDITYIKQAEDELLLTQQVFSETAEAIIIFDEQQNVLSSNRAFIEMSRCDKSAATRVTRFFLADHPEILRQLQNTSRWQGEGILKCVDNSTLPVLVSATKLSCMNAENRYALLFRDISAQKAVKKRLKRLAMYDSLTGLPNRSLFKQRLDNALSRDSQLFTAVMFIDLDHFKNINDTYGHPVGDQLLYQVAERLRTCVQAKDTVARFGGDEFIVILCEVKNCQQIEKIAQRILTTLSKPFELDSLQCFSSASIGIALAGNGSKDADRLISNADQAMYQAKKSGRDGFQFFDVEINYREQKRYQCAEDLHKALESDELFLQYQPRFDIDGCKIVGVEALIRWRHREHGLISPEEFIPIAEGSNLILEIGRFVLYEACRQAASWNAEGYHIPVSVNLSSRQLGSYDLLQDIKGVLRDTGLPGHMLELEITETLLMESLSQVQPKLKRIRAMGVKFSIDDFGTGYSSLMYLKELPVDTLKIDRSFIKDIPGTAEDENLVQAMISMSHSLHLRVVAEGVENKEQYNFLCEQDCDELQGFLLGRPDSVEKLKELVGSHK